MTSSARTKVLLTTQVFPPEIHPTAVMADDLARGLVDRGFDVWVATGLPHHPTGRVAAGYPRGVHSVEERAGFHVVRIWHPTSPNRRILSRASVMAAQSVATALGATRAREPDVVLSFGGPPLLGPVLSGFVAGIRRAPLVTLIHDIYPDVAAETEAVTNPWLLKAATLVERLQYRMSDSIIVLGEATRELLVRRGVDASRIHVVPVWLDPDEIRPRDRDTAWRRQQGLRPSDFVVLYSGTVGIISGAEILTDVARYLPEDVTVCVVGGGRAWDALEAATRAPGAPTNLRVLPYQPRDVLNDVQASADLSLVTLQPGRGRTSVPSKVQGYMAAGRPILAAVEPDCDTALLIEREGIGRVVPLSARAVADAVLESRANAAQLGIWGRRAREVFERDHAREAVIDRYAALLRQAAMR